MPSTPRSVIGCGYLSDGSKMPSVSACPGVRALAAALSASIGLPARQPPRVGQISWRRSRPGRNRLRSPAARRRSLRGTWGGLAITPACPGVTAVKWLLEALEAPGTGEDSIGKPSRRRSSGPPQQPWNSIPQPVAVAKPDRVVPQLKSAHLLTVASVSPDNRRHTKTRTTFGGDLQTGRAVL